MGMCAVPNVTVLFLNVVKLIVLYICAYMYCFKSMAHTNDVCMRLIERCVVHVYI